MMNPDELIYELEHHESEEIIERGLQFVSNTQGHAFTTVVSSLSKASKASDALIIDALKRNWQHPDIAQALFLCWANRQRISFAKLLVQCMANSQNVAERENYTIAIIGVHGNQHEIMDACWPYLENLRGSERYIEVLGIVAIYTNTPVVMTAALECIAEYYDHPLIATLISRLLTKDPQNAELRSVAKDWLKKKKKSDKYVDVINSILSYGRY